jgi:collagenase-like PrtC family protease
MRVSLAPVPYFWSKERYQAFSRSVAESPVDIVYLGETVCSKRRAMRLEDWIDIAQLLSQHGKQAVLSTLTLLEADSELRQLTRIASQKDFLIEANDIAAVQVASENDNAFVVGSAINVYNNRTLALMKTLGMRRWVVPVELGRDDIQPMMEFTREFNVEVEYQVYGRLPLAWSARCFTARHLDLRKDDCQLKCQDYEQGIAVYSQEKQVFSQINGIQTQSGHVTNLLERWLELRAAGVDILRVVPVAAADTLKVLDYLHSQVIDEPSIPPELANDYAYCNGYWLQRAGMSFTPLEGA